MIGCAHARAGYRLTLIDYTHCTGAREYDMSLSSCSTAVTFFLHGNNKYVDIAPPTFPSKVPNLPCYLVESDNKPYLEVQ